MRALMNGADTPAPVAAPPPLLSLWVLFLQLNKRNFKPHDRSTMIVCIGGAQAGARRKRAIACFGCYGRIFLARVLVSEAGPCIEDHGGRDVRGPQPASATSSFRGGLDRP
jgi:hypothetical protein